MYLTRNPRSRDHEKETNISKKESYTGTTMCAKERRCIFPSPNHNKNEVTQSKPQTKMRLPIINEEMN